MVIVSSVHVAHYKFCSDDDDDDVCVCVCRVDTLLTLCAWTHEAAWYRDGTLDGAEFC